MRQLQSARCFLIVVARGNYLFNYYFIYYITLALVGTQHSLRCCYRNMRDNKHAFCFFPFRGVKSIAEQTCESFYYFASRSYKHLYHQVTGSASVLLNLRSSNEYGRVVSDPIEGAPYDERPLLVLRNAAGA